jgi:DNA-binding LytR/AlgR family response regulator
VFMLQKYKPLAPIPHREPAPQLATTAQDLMLTAENEKDFLTLPAQDLLFIEADDNYCTVVYLERDKVHKKLLRSSLTRLENQVTAFNIVRCHRSYLVNLDQVKSVSGNAQGYRLHFPMTPGTVPVARSSSGMVKAAFAPV